MSVASGTVRSHRMPPRRPSLNSSSDSVTRRLAATERYTPLRGCGATLGGGAPVKSSDSFAGGFMACAARHTAVVGCCQPCVYAEASAHDVTTRESNSDLPKSMFSGSRWFINHTSGCAECGTNTRQMLRSMHSSPVDTHAESQSHAPEPVSDTGRPRQGTHSKSIHGTTSAPCSGFTGCRGLAGTAARTAPALALARPEKLKIIVLKFLSTRR